MGESVCMQTRCRASVDSRCHWQAKGLTCASMSHRSDGSPTGKQLALMRRSPSLPPDGVVHLIIRKSGAGLHWRHAPGAKLELSISADATVEDVAAELEAADDLPAAQHQLMYNGEVCTCPSYKYT